MRIKKIFVSFNWRFSFETKSGNPPQLLIDKRWRETEIVDWRESLWIRIRVVSSNRCCTFRLQNENWFNERAISVPYEPLFSSICTIRFICTMGYILLHLFSFVYSRYKYREMHNLSASSFARSVLYLFSHL